MPTATSPTQPLKMPSQVRRVRGQAGDLYELIFLDRQDRIIVPLTEWYRLPFDMGLAYAFVDGQWLQCTADAFLQVQGRSEREWELILDEWREQQRAHHRKRVSIDSSLLAAFLEEVLTEEALLSQQQRDLEGVSIREAIVGQSKATGLETSNADIEMDDELDLTSLPTLEEYR